MPGGSHPVRSPHPRMGRGARVMAAEWRWHCQCRGRVGVPFHCGWKWEKGVWRSYPKFAS